MSIDESDQLGFHWIAKDLSFLHVGIKDIDRIWREAYAELSLRLALTPHCSFSYGATQKYRQAEGLGMSMYFARTYTL